jgi:hypothetical protein
VCGDLTIAGGIEQALQNIAEMPEEEGGGCVPGRHSCSVTSCWI